MQILSRVEERVLSQIIDWADEFKRQIDSGERFAAHKMPTTDRCSTHFRYKHNEMLAILNRLEGWGLIAKRRRRSAGLSGDGYDGSLHSEVIPTKHGRAILTGNKVGKRRAYDSFRPMPLRGRA